MTCEQKLAVFMELGKAASHENDLDTLLAILAGLARRIVDADRCSIFVYDKEKNELWTKVAEGVEGEIRLPVNQGIAGHTAVSKEIQIVLDAYNDYRFCKDVDKRTGYVTRTILAVPMFNWEGNVVGVFQALNKATGPFGMEDADSLLLVADYAGTIIENAVLRARLERRYAEKSRNLAKSEERFELIALSTNDGVWDWDVAGEEVYFSGRYHQILGYRADELPSTLDSLLGRIYPEDRETVDRLFKDHMEFKTPFHAEFRVVTKSRELKWVLARGQAVWDRSEAPVRMVGAYTDITAAKEQESQLTKRKEELEEANERIATLLKDQDSFIKNAMHEINTPISIINTHLEMIERDIKEKKYLQRILSATKTLSGIYDDFNYIVTRERDNARYRKQEVDLSRFVRDRADYFKDIAKANGVRMETDIAPAVATLFNPIELERVVDNTLSNAIKYNKEGGAVYVTLVGSGHPTFSVRDEGVGIREPEQVFKRYYRESLHKGGFGIGLTIVKTICDENGVTVDVRSKAGQGAEFIYRFPPFDPETLQEANR